MMPTNIRRHKFLQPNGWRIMIEFDLALSHQIIFDSKIGLGLWIKLIVDGHKLFSDYLRFGTGKTSHEFEIEGYKAVFTYEFPMLKAKKARIQVSDKIIMNWQYDRTNAFSGGQLLDSEG